LGINVEIVMVVMVLSFVIIFMGMIFVALISNGALGVENGK
jgi:hypothetical protein